MNKVIGAPVVCAFSVLVACTSGDSTPPAQTNDAVVADGVVVADDGFAADARVSADHVDIVTQGHEAGLANIHAGSILVSRRSFTHPDRNPYGFIRHVVSVSTNGSDAVIMTTQATLADAIVHGSINVVPTPEPATDPTLSTRTLHPLGAPAPTGGITIGLPDVTILDTGTQNVASGAAGASGSLSVKLVGNSLQLGATPEFSASFDWGTLKAFRTSLTISYDAKSKLAVAGDGEVDLSVEKTIAEMDLGNYFFFVGFVPVEITVKAKVSVGCSVFASGKIDASASWHAFGSPKVGVDFKDGQFTSIGNPTDFTLETDTEVKAETNVGVKCEMPVELDVFLYDVAGPFAALAPIAELSTASSTCTPPKIGIAIDAYDELRLGVKAEVLGKSASWNWSTDTPKVHLWPKADAAAATCPTGTTGSTDGGTTPNDCQSDTQCGANKACAWNGMIKCCRTPAASSATKCFADTDCGSGEVCGWNLQYFVCQAPACN